MRVDDEDRDAILRRRNRLVALALSGLATMGCDALFGPCLSIDPGPARAPLAPSDGPQLPPEAPETTPRPCLSRSVPPDELPLEEPPDDEAAPPDAPRTRTGPAPPARGALPPGAGPMVCLSDVLVEGVDEPAPQPCLRKS